MHSNRQTQTDSDDSDRLGQTRTGSDRLGQTRTDSEGHHDGGRVEDADLGPAAVGVAVEVHQHVRLHAVDHVCSVCVCARVCACVRARARARVPESSERASERGVSERVGERPRGPVTRGWCRDGTDGWIGTGVVGGGAVMQRGGRGRRGCARIERDRPAGTCAPGPSLEKSRMDCPSESGDSDGLETRTACPSERGLG